MSNLYTKRIKKIKGSIAEAERFIKTAEMCIDRLSLENGTQSPCCNTKEHGAMLRSSLDLSMVLRELRRPLADD